MKKTVKHYCIIRGVIVKGSKSEDEISAKYLGNYLLPHCSDGFLLIALFCTLHLDCFGWIGDPKIALNKLHFFALFLNTL